MPIRKRNEDGDHPDRQMEENCPEIKKRRFLSPEEWDMTVKELLRKDEERTRKRQLEYDVLPRRARIRSASIPFSGPPTEEYRPPKSVSVSSSSSSVCQNLSSAFDGVANQEDLPTHLPSQEIQKENNEVPLPEIAPTLLSSHEIQEPSQEIQEENNEEPPEVIQKEPLWTKLKGFIPAWSDIKGFMPRITPARVMLFLSVLAMFIPGYLAMTEPWTLKGKVNFMKSIIKVLSPALAGSKEVLVYSALSMYIPHFFEPGANPVPKPDRYAQSFTPDMGVCPANHTFKHILSKKNPKKNPRVQRMFFLEFCPVNYLMFTLEFCPVNYPAKHKVNFTIRDNQTRYNQTRYTAEDSAGYIPRAFYDSSIVSFIAMAMTGPIFRQYFRRRDNTETILKNIEIMQQKTRRIISQPSCLRRE
jgi:hypothetical protein